MIRKDGSVDVGKKNVSFTLSSEEDEPSSRSSNSNNNNNNSPNILKSTTIIEIEHYTDYDEETRKSLWYSRSDYHFSRSTARVIAKESERYGHSKQLDGVYISAYDEKVQASLNVWCVRGHSRRGLERWANTHHGRVRKDDQYMYLQSILRTQHEMKSTQRPAEERAERLREVSFILSRKSRLFAQMMGEADRQASQVSSMDYNNHNNHNNTSSSTSTTSSAATATATEHAHRSTTTTTRPMSHHHHQHNHHHHDPSMNMTMMTMRIPPLPAPSRRRNLGLQSVSSVVGSTARKVNSIADLPSSSTSSTTTTTTMDSFTVASAPTTDTTISSSSSSSSSSRRHDNDAIIGGIGGGNSVNNNNNNNNNRNVVSAPTPATGGIAIRRTTTTTTPPPPIQQGITILPRRRTTPGSGRGTPGRVPRMA
jgi:hypothetical protein